MGWDGIGWERGGGGGWMGWLAIIGDWRASRAGGLWGFRSIRACRSAGGNPTEILILLRRNSTNNSYMLVGLGLFL
jgi:hypothetical protein